MAATETAVIGRCVRACAVRKLAQDWHHKDASLECHVDSLRADDRTSRGRRVLAVNQDQGAVAAPMLSWATNSTQKSQMTATNGVCLRSPDW